MPTMKIQDLKIKASEVRLYDFLVLLDNGYVVEIEHDHYDRVVLTFHDAEGDENVLTLQPNHPITIRRTR
jgi:hypothetical protein